MWSRAFWADAAERAIKTFCQVLATLMVGDGVGLLDVNWWHVLSLAGMAAVVSVLTTIASAGVTGGSASLLDPYTVIDEQAATIASTTSGKAKEG